MGNTALTVSLGVAEEEVLAEEDLLLLSAEIDRFKADGHKSESPSAPAMLYYFR